jgi:predicted secreted protein
MSRKFLPAYTKEFKFIVAGKNESHALCTYCNLQINLSSKGKAAITQHTESGKHKENAKTAAENQVLTLFVKPKRSSEEDKIAAAEGTWSYHIAKHGQSLQSADCTSSNGLFQSMFSGSNVAKEFSCARAKTTKIITSKFLLFCSYFHAGQSSCSINC